METSRWINKSGNGYSKVHYLKSCGNLAQVDKCS